MMPAGSAAGLHRGEKSGRLEDTQVRAHAEPSHLRQPFREVSERLPVFLLEGIQQRAAARVAQRLEDVVHGTINR